MPEPQSIKIIIDPHPEENTCAVTVITTEGDREKANWIKLPGVIVDDYERYIADFIYFVLKAKQGDDSATFMVKQLSA